MYCRLCGIVECFVRSFEIRQRLILERVGTVFILVFFDICVVASAFCLSKRKE